MKSARVSELRIRHLYTHTHFYHVRSPCVGVSFAALALAASGATASVATASVQVWVIGPLWTIRNA